MLDPECIFCKIVQGTISAKIIMQDEKSIAFLDAFPLAEGHALVIPKTHFANFQDMDSDLVKSVTNTLWMIIPAIEKAANSTASTIAIHNGKDAGQEIGHVHIHIIPRKKGDGASTVHSMFKNRPKVNIQQMDAMLSEIQKLLKPNI